MSDFNSLLPSNSTALEKRLERTFASRLDAMDGDYGTIDPLTCDVKMLPVLAWLFRVPEWDASWPESLQRQVVASQPFVKRHCGTVAAVESALAALMVRTKIIEWFDTVPNGPRGTFIVRAFVNSRFNQGVILTPKLINQIRNLAAYSKPVSRHFDFQIGVEASSKMRAAAALGGAIKQRFTSLSLKPRTDTFAGARASGAFCKPLKIMNFEMVGLAI